ncbi:MAG: hypothetical protein P8P45_02090 [Flavobacteriales bacterium]|nr:hypothetical protein [Flavobacteriales bacterium]
MPTFDWNRHHAEQERKERRKAAVLSGLTYVAILAACVFLVAFQEVTPPPGERFVAVGMADFGNVNEADGDRETEVPSEQVEEVIEQEVSEAVSEEVAPIETVETQEVSEVEVPTQEEVVEEVTEVEAPDPEPEISNDLSNALSQMFSNSGGGGSEGADSGTGNSGTEDGKIEGSGVVSGEPTGELLDGGKMIGKPNLNGKPQSEGVVRMKVYVDKNGTVTEAKYDPENSTTSNNRLVELARQSAMTAKFESHPIKPTRIGWIEFNFKLQ